MKPIVVLGWVLIGITAALAQIPHPNDAPQAKTPEESAASFKVPEGFRIEVVASEPLISSPSAVCWDEHGRMFVSELHGYNLAGELDIEELNKTGKLDTEVRRVQADKKFKDAAKSGTFGVIKLLTDTDDDGRMDRAQVWATNLPPAYGLVPARGGIIVACAPDIIYFADRDGDGWAETREVLFTGFPTGELERGINAPQWGDDGWIYFGRGWGGGKITGSRLKEPVQLPGSDFRIRANGSAIEPVTGQTHTFGFAITEAGDRFTVNTTIPGIYIAPLPWRYLARNPDLATPSLELATGDRRAYSLSKPHPWRQKRAEDPAYFKYYNSRYGAAESEADGWFTAACGPMVYRDNVLPGLHGEYFVCEPAGNLIHRAIIKQDGSTLKLERAAGESRSEFAASNDTWSHPMNLTHGSDGAIWIVDYSREIIEDYSAIPRHLQQQYGVYNGHDRGRIYRLTHRDAAKALDADLSKLNLAALVKECSSELYWRRQTAQRLLRERRDLSAIPLLRTALRQNPGDSAIITLLFALDQLDAIEPADLQPLISHSDSAVRTRALQLADRWFSRPEGTEILRAAREQAQKESDARVQIRFALSLGQAASDDSTSFAVLARYAREHLAIRWMDTAILSSLHGRGVRMLEELAGSDRAPTSFLSSLGQMIGASRDEQEITKALRLIASAMPEAQVAVLIGLKKSRDNAARERLNGKDARDALAVMAASADPEVRSAARSLTESFVPAAANEATASSGQSAVQTPLSDEKFRTFVRALNGARNLQHGRELFLAGCATCHRISSDGHEVGPDLLGQIGMAEEALLKDILMPNERIRPGYETTEVETRGGAAIIGLLKGEGATSVTLVQPGGVEQVILRKDIAGVRRLATSLMPSFAETLTPQDAADLLGWLRSNLGASAPYMELRVYSVTSGKMDAVIERFRDTVDPVRRKHGIDTLGYWSAPGKTNGGAFAYLMVAPSKEELQKREKEFGADPQFKEGYAASQKKYGNTVDRIETFSLSAEATGSLDFTRAAKPRIFELRIYSIEPGKLQAFRDRWRDRAVPLYEKKGVHNIGWWVCAERDAQGHEQFICLLAAESADAIQRAVSEFHSDPDWQRIEKETEREGKLRSSVVAYKLTPLEFSALK